MDTTIIDGRYELVADIGGGGEARVYQARDQQDGSDVALRLALQPGTKITGDAPAIQHENWVELLASGEDATFGVYQIFELLQGQTLAQCVDSAPLTTDQWRLFVTQSLDAVEALHAAGWVHGDLNADNFFAHETGWKLLELPFLRLEPPPGRTAAFGSIFTLAPEQIDRKPATVASDIYSLGCLYYYAASGSYPHSGATAHELAISRLCFEPESLAGRAPDLPAAWRDAVMGLLARQPEQRPESVAAARQLLNIA